MTPTPTTSVVSPTPTVARSSSPATCPPLLVPGTTVPGGVWALGTVSVPVLVVGRDPGDPVPLVLLQPLGGTAVGSRRTLIWQGKEKCIGWLKINLFTMLSLSTGDVEGFL